MWYYQGEEEEEENKMYSDKMEEENLQEDRLRRMEIDDSLTKNQSPDQGLNFIPPIQIQKPVQQTDEDQMFELELNDDNTPPSIQSNPLVSNSPVDHFPGTLQSTTTSMSLSGSQSFSPVFARTPPKQPSSPRFHESPSHHTTLSGGDGHRLERSEIQLMKLSLLEATSAEQILQDKQQLSNLLDKFTCEALIPESSKMVVLDTCLAVKSAFHALEENGIKSAPLWDEKKQDYVGIITVTDFIEILLHFHKQPNVDIFSELEKHQIKTWKEIMGRGERPLIYSNPDDTLYQASQILLKHRIHRLPIVDRAESNTILHIITHYRILAFLNERIHTRPSIFSFSVESLGIGTYKNVITVLRDTPLHVVLTLLAEGKISAVPVIDENGLVLDVYSKSDVISLIKYVEGNFLDEPVGKILEYKKKEFMFTCSKSDTLGQIFGRLVQTRVHRLICVDSTNRVEGIISLSDILQYFIINKM